MLALEQHNLSTALRYLELYNHDIERFVRECYHQPTPNSASGPTLVP